MENVSSAVPFRYRRLERRTFEARWPMLVVAVVLVLIAQSPPMWVSLLALVGFAAHNVARLLLLVRAPAVWFVRGGTILFSLDLGVILVGAWPLLHGGITAVIIVLYALQFEAIARCRIASFPYALGGIVASTLMLAIYATVAAPLVGGQENAIARIILFVLVGGFGIFDVVQRYRRQQHVQPLAVSPAGNMPADEITQQLTSSPACERIKLTRQQRRVLLLVEEGLTNDEIADRMSIGAETVKTHLRGAYKRLGVGDRESAARAARDHGLLG